MPRDNLPALVRDAALQVIQGLEWAADDPGFTLAGRVYGEIDQDDSNVTMPCWLLTSAGEKEQPLPGDSEWRYWVFPWKLLLRDSRGPGDHSRDAQYRSWRWEALQEFHERKPISDLVPACYWSEVETEGVYEDAKKAGFLDLQGAMRLKFFCRTPRYPSTAAANAAQGLVPPASQ